MQEIGRASKLYALDNNGKWPPTLLGYPKVRVGFDPKSEPRINPLAVTYAGCATASDPILSAESVPGKPLQGRQHYLKAVDLYHCPDSPNKDSKAIVSPVWPTTVGRNGAVYTLNSATLQPDVCPGKDPIAANYIVASFYAYDSYDVGLQLDNNGKKVTPEVQELHYSPDWTGKVNDLTDPPNQLKYPDAPDTTVVTWCTYHAAINGFRQKLSFCSSQEPPGRFRPKTLPSKAR